MTADRVCGPARMTYFQRALKSRFPYVSSLVTTTNEILHNYEDTVPYLLAINERYQTKLN